MQLVRVYLLDKTELLGHEGSTDVWENRVDHQRRRNVIWLNGALSEDTHATQVLAISKTGKPTLIIKPSQTFIDPLPYPIKIPWQEHQTLSIKNLIKSQWINLDQERNPADHIAARYPRSNNHGNRLKLQTDTYENIQM